MAGHSTRIMAIPNVRDSKAAGQSRSLVESALRTFEAGAGLREVAQKRRQRSIGRFRRLFHICRPPAEAPSRIVIF
jgi:hypothetical protein